MNAVELQQRISHFFEEEVNVDVPSPGTDLVESGALDSLTFVNLLVHLEQEFRVEVSFDDLDMDNFCSVDKIARFVMKQQEAARMAQGLQKLAR